MKANELCDLAIEWLKKEYPDSTIVTEMSLADWGRAKVDVAAITDTEIVGVELKGEGDTPTRLELQGLVYGRVCRRMWLLADTSIQEKCFNKKPSGWGRLEIYDGQVRPWNRAKKVIGYETVKKSKYYGEYERAVYGRDDSKYDPDISLEEVALCPWSMCGTLWKNELHEIAKDHNMKIAKSANVYPLTEAIINTLPMPIIHQSMIHQLRKREWRKPVIDLRK